MQIVGIQIDSHFLRTRVARRIFLLFVTCALLPVGAFAALAYRQVTAQLKRDARDELRAEAKVLGMSTVERILLLDGALRLAGTALGGSSEASVKDILGVLPGSMRTHFRSIALIGGESAMIPGNKPEAGLLLGPTPEERTRLSAGETLLRTAPSDTHIRIFLLRAIPGRSTGLIEAELEPAYVFDSALLREGSHLLVVDPVEGLVFSDLASSVSAKKLIELAQRATRQQILSLSTAGDRQLAGTWDLYLRASFQVQPIWTIIVTRPESDILAPLHQFHKVFLLVALLAIWTVLFLSVSQIRRSLVPIDLLKAATARIAARDLDVSVSIQSADEFQDLGDSFNQMALRISQHVTNMAMINEIGAALSAERDTSRLLDLIVQGAMRLARAEIGALYLLAPDGQLTTGLVRTAKPRGGDQTTTPERDLTPLAKRLAEQVARSGTRIEHEDIAAARGPGAGHQSDGEIPFCRVFLTIPLRNHEEEIIGVLQLINSHDSRPGGAPAFSEEDREVAESLASQAAVALTKQSLVDSFMALFEGLIQLIVRAVDEKSPYTGDHCRRVPILTELIAQAACDAREGPFKSFSLTDEERYELRIAALLHDCGKVTTPVHVVDKGTKLETLFDRIHLVDTRFEVLKRDAEIRTLRRLAGLHEAGSPLPAEAGASLFRELQRLDEERAFLRSCNIGSERMDLEDMERVRAIAASHRWRAPGGGETSCLSAEEVENLTVERGTLNEREREIINYHVVATINMLRDLPYPKSLRRVPEIAGAHHERLDGSGYPQRLSGAQVSMPARILGLADVFEALTAKDRPYKRGRTLREALAILRGMRDNGQIDSDLFDLFVDQRIYLAYAMECLGPEQIDDQEPTQSASMSRA